MSAHADDFLIIEKDLMKLTKEFKNKFQIRNIEEKLSAYIRSQQTKIEDRLMKVHNEKYIKEVVYQFKAKHSNMSKENAPIPPSCYLEKDESRHLFDKKTTEYQRMIGMFEQRQSTIRIGISNATALLARFLEEDQEGSGAPEETPGKGIDC